MDASRLARFVAFASLGSLSVVQEIAGAILEDVIGAEPDLVAEETLSLVATATARSAEVALRSVPDLVQPASEALLDIPFIYRDYLIGGAMIDARDSSVVDEAGDVYARLQRKREFYSVHLPPNQFPGERTLRDKMGLWMGRISPPGLPEMPTARLEKLDLVSPLLRHLKLVLAFGQKG